MGTAEANKKFQCFQFSIKSKFDPHLVYILVIIVPSFDYGPSYVSRFFSVCLSFHCYLVENPADIVNMVYNAAS